MRGGDQGHGRGKRQASTPVGCVYKDSRRNIHVDKTYEDDDQWTQVIYNPKKSPTNQPKPPSKNRLEETTNCEMPCAGATSRAASGTTWKGSFPMDLTLDNHQ